MARVLMSLAPPELACEVIEIGGLSLYDQDLDDKPPAAWTEFRERIRSKDGVLFVTPEYNRSVPGVLKNAIDVGSRPYGKSAWAGKPAAVISVSPGTYGGFGANHHLRQSLVFLDMPAMQQPEAYIAHAADLFNEAGDLTNDHTREFAARFMAAFAKWVEGKG
jgi:chromate reductase